MNSNSQQRIRKVLLVAHRDWFLYNFELPVAQELRRRGSDVVMVCPSGEFVPKLEELGFRVIRWRLRRSSLNLFSELAALFDLIRCYHREKPDLLLHFTIKPCLYGSLAALMLRKIGFARQALSKCYGSCRIVNHFTGLGFVFSSSPTAAVLRRMLIPVMRLVFDAVRATFLFQNESDLDTFVRCRLSRPEQSAIVPTTGVDPCRFRPSECAVERRPVVLFGGRILWEKGIREFVKAAQMLAGETDAEFWVASVPDEGNQDAVPKNIIDEWKAAGIVKFIGMQTNMPELLRKVDIAVLPSYHEGLSCFLLEAAATGLPLIASDIPGCKEIVCHDGNGYLVPVGDVMALANAIRRLLRDPLTRQQFGSASRLIFLERYTEPMMTAKYCEFYDSAATPLVHYTANVNSVQT